MRSDQKDLLKSAAAEGWAVERTRNGHLKFTHPRAERPVFAPATPSDYRSAANTRAALRRALKR